MRYRDFFFTTGCLCGFVLSTISGCAAFPSGKNQDLLVDTVVRAGLKPEIGGFQVKQVVLRAEALTFFFSKKDLPGEFWVMRFAESPYEQKPGLLKSVDKILKSLSASKKKFEIITREKLLPWKDHPVQGVSYSFSEKNKTLYGFLCLWQEKLEKGAWIYILNLIMPEKISPDKPLALLKELPGE